MAFSGPDLILGEVQLTMASGYTHCRQWLCSSVDFCTAEGVLNMCVVYWSVA